MSRKHWDYEDDHDWDDAIDYKEKGYVYWYGKYYPKEDIDALFPEENTGKGNLVLLALAGAAVGGIYGIVKTAPYVVDWWANIATKHKNLRNRKGM